MALMKMPCAVGSGGGANTGELDLTSATSGATGTFDTGLGSNLKKVTIIRTVSPAPANAPAFEVAYWDADNSNYSANAYGDTGSSGRVLGAGVKSLTDMASAIQFGIGITGVNNGVVTYKIGSSHYQGQYTWYAE